MSGMEGGAATSVCSRRSSSSQQVSSGRLYKTCRWQIWDEATNCFVPFTWKGCVCCCAALAHCSWGRAGGGASWTEARHPLHCTILATVIAVFTPSKELVMQQITADIIDIVYSDAHRRIKQHRQLPCCILYNGCPHERLSPVWAPADLGSETQRRREVTLSWQVLTLTADELWNCGTPGFLTPALYCAHRVASTLSASTVQFHSNYKVCLKGNWPWMVRTTVVPTWRRWSVEDCPLLSIVIISFRQELPVCVQTMNIV